MVELIHCNGEINFEMEPFYVSCLEGIIANCFFRTPSIQIEKNKIIFQDGFEDIGVTSSIFLFIKTYGKLISGKIDVSKEEGYPFEFHVQEGDVWKWKYGYSESEVEDVSLQDFVTIHNTDSLIDILSNESEQSEELNDSMFSLFEQKTITERKLKQISETIVSVLKPSESLLLHYEKNHIRISSKGFSKSRISIVKKEPLEQFIKTEELAFDRDLAISKTEKRKIDIGKNNLYPLIEPLMTQFTFEANKQEIPSNKNVLLEDGSKVNSCSLCVYRLQKMIDGCELCTPLLQSRKDEEK